MEINYAIRWIVIYPVDSTIQRLNNQYLVEKCYPTFDGVLIHYAVISTGSYHVVCKCDNEDIKSSPLYFVPVCALQQPV